MTDRTKGLGLEATVSDEVPATLVLPADEERAPLGTEPTQLARGTDEGRPRDAAAETVVARPRTARSSSESRPVEKTGPAGDERARYEVLDEIGRGGLGRVVRATDRKLARTVAIKQLHERDPELERRFLDEAMVTAQLQHPSIVAIYDTGRYDDAPFYAMKLVDGRSLAELLREAETPAERLAFLPSLLAVANAIAFAHHEKVIHRDLKPHNVIVGDYGETIVIDWGLAKQLGDDEGARSLRPAMGGASSETRAGDILGTPSYMAPEQARGDAVDERSDVFALGAMLYELLTGRAPYLGPSASVTLSLARLGRAPAVASLVPEAPADLVAIANKAMAREPADRYATAALFAKDLDDFLTGRLVGSHRYSSWELLRRWVRRHRITVAVAAALLAVLAVASALFVRQIMHERDAADAQRLVAEEQRGEAVVARAEAEARRTEAETRRVAADEVVGYMLTELRAGLTRVGRLDLMRGVVGQVDAYYARVSSVDHLDEAAAARRAEAIRTLGEVLDIGGQTAQARRALERAVAMLEPRAGVGRQTPERRVALATAQVDLALVLQEQGEADAALALLRKIPKALADVAPSADVEHVLARTHRRIGIIESSREPAAARVALDKAIAHAQAAVRANPKMRVARAELAAAHDRLADLVAPSKLSDAIAQARAGLAIREELYREDPGDISVRQGIAVSWDKLYYYALGSNDLAAADKAAASSLAIAEFLSTIDPDNDDWARQLFVARERPARLAYERDDGARAVVLEQLAVDVAERRAIRITTPAAQADLADALAHLGDYLTMAKQLPRAIEVLGRAQKITDELRRKEPANLDYKLSAAALHENLGTVYFDQQNYGAATEEYRRRLELDAELVKLAPDNAGYKVNFASTQFRAGISMSHLSGRRDEGVAMARAALGAFRDLDKAGHLTPDMQQTIPEREKAIAERAR